MQIDDRLSTVLRKRAGSAAAARTQLRQLLDLLGAHASSAEDAQSTLLLAGYARLDELMRAAPQDTLARILREPGLRLRSPSLVYALSDGPPKVAASVMATARLGEDEWLALIPRLPVPARGFLRHRRDLPARVVRQLEQLGVRDLVLPDPGYAEFEAVEAKPEPAPAPQPREAAPTPAPTPEPVTAPQPAPRPSPQPRPSEPLAPVEEADSIASLLKRIEAFRGNRRAPVYAPRLPLGDAPQGEQQGRIESADFRCDADGIVTWASREVAPWLVGMRLTAPNPGQLVRFASARTAILLRRHAPLKRAAITIDAAPGISGRWACDAVPAFADGSGAFEGYRGRLRRAPEIAAPDVQDSAGDQTRQLLHELRTPVNAIQGFAEIIQQQLFGTVPHEYRAHAAAIAVDSAKLLAGFDEIDRLTRLESGALTLENGEADLRDAVRGTLRRLEGVLEPRGAGFDQTLIGTPFATGMGEGELEQMIWRILATVAGSLGLGEKIRLDMIADNERLRLKLDWPVALRERLEARFADPSRRPVVTASMFHSRFALRLADAEARAAGGKLKLGGKRITLTLPPMSGSGTQDEGQNKVAKQAGASGDT